MVERFLGGERFFGGRAEIGIGTKSANLVLVWIWRILKVALVIRGSGKNVFLLFYFFGGFHRSH